MAAMGASSGSSCSGMAHVEVGGGEGHVQQGTGKRGVVSSGGAM